MRQGGDRGSQYRSTIYCYTDDQLAMALQSKDEYQKELKSKKSFGAITTEIRSMKEMEFYYAEDYHQQYLSKDPGGYCGLKGTGVACPLPKKEKKSEEQATEKREQKDDL